MDAEPDADLRRRLERHIDELPVLPTVLARLLTLDPEADGFFEEMLSLVESDATFATRALSAANSASSAPSSPVVSVRGALARLGTSGVRSLIMAVAVARVFVPRDAWEASLWRHTLQVSGAARRLALLDPERIVDADAMYAGGLLHDVGRFVMFAEAPDTLRQIDEGTWDSPLELVEAERSICGLTHTEIGALACSRWGLPASVEYLVSHHHDHVVDVHDPSPGAASVALLRFADLAMFPSAIPGAPAIDDPAEIERELLPYCPSWLPLTATQLQAVIIDTVSETDRIATELGVGSQP